MVKQFRQKEGRRFRQLKNDKDVKQQVRETKIQEPTQIKEDQELDNVREKDEKNQKNQKNEKSKGKRNRLIIRNIVFDINQKHLKKLLQPYGQIVDLEIPLNPNNNKCNRGFAFVEFKNFRSCQKAIKQLNQSNFKGRTIVIDFSINKQRFMSSKLQQNIEKKSPEIQEQIVKQTDQKQFLQQKIQQQIVNNDEQIKKQRQAEDLSSTIFIRNLPISVSQDQLANFFKKIGKIRWARIVFDKQANISKGTAFVKFVDPKIAQQLIEYSRSYQMFLLNKNPRFKSNPKYSLEIQGTILKIFPGQKRQAIADKMKQREEKDAIKNVKVKPLKRIKKLKDLITFDKEGKRNIALAQYGLFQPNDDMSQEDQLRFSNHYKQKIQKLKNPNNLVSDKRIILKFLDKSITQEQLKDLAHQFLNTYKLRSKELIFCKLMLDKTRTKSAGFAFIQFAHHEHSKTFIEELTQNYTYLMKRPYVIQFAIQDSRKMQKILHSKK